MERKQVTRPKLEPLKVSCSTTDCENELHCFRTSRQRAGQNEGACRECGADLVDWERIRKRDLRDLSNTVAELRKEWIRHHFGHEELDQHAINPALRKGRSGIRSAAEQRIRTSVGIKGSRDGRQTPFSRNILHYAQHAMACCCRRCIEYWHGIPADQPLTDSEILYFTDLCLHYVWERMPDLPEQGQHVPPIRRGGSK